MENQLSDLCSKIAGFPEKYPAACTDVTFSTIDNALAKALALLQEKQDLELRLTELTKQLQTKTEEFNKSAGDLEAIGKDIKAKEAQINEFTEKLGQAEATLNQALAQGADKAEIQGQLDQVRQELALIGKAKEAVDQEKADLQKQIGALTAEIQTEKATKEKETQNCQDLIAELNRKLQATAETAAKILG